MKKTTGVLAFILIIGIAFFAFAQQEAQKAEDTTKTGIGMDQHFMQKVAAGNMMEIQLSETAKEKATSDEVKTFATKLATDHGKALADLKSLAATKNVSLPTDIPADNKPMLAKISNATGASFDREYVRTMVVNHAKNVAKFRKASQKLTDPDLKNWVTSILPTLEEHLTQAKAIGTKLGIDVDAAQKEGETEAAKSSKESPSK